MRKLACAGLIGLGLSACFFDSSKSTANASPADQNTAMALARQGMDSLSNNPTTVNQNRFNTTRSLFAQALAKDPNNGLANLGMGLTLMISAQYDAQIQQQFGSSTGSPAGTARLLTGVSKWTIAQATQPSSLTFNQTNMLGVTTLQNYIDSTITPRLDSAENYLGKAISAPGSDTGWVFTDNNLDTIRISKAELYITRAGLYTVQGAMNLATLYDLNVLDPNGTTNWVGQAQAFSNAGMEFSMDSVIATAAQSSLKRSGFLAWRTGKNSSTIKTNLTNAVNDLNSAVAAVRKGPDLANCVLTQAILDQFDSSYTQNVSGQNGFTGTKTENALAWIQNVINGSAITTQNNGVSFNIAPGAFLNPGIQDLKSLLPYYSFNPTPATWQSAGISNFTDANGNIVSQPVFKDYTFGGILPGMTASLFQQVGL